MKLSVWTTFVVLGFLCGCFSPSDSGSADNTRPVGERTEQGEADPAADEANFFTPLRDEVGISFDHYNAATEERWLPETMGSGVAFFDYDNDQFPDLYFVNGASLGKERNGSPTGHLYHNRRDGTFEDVTDGSGLDERFFGMGVAVGDLENDGLLDLAVTGVDKVRIFRNLGNGQFRNVTDEAGIDCPGFGASLAFLDYDLDGYLDLFVTRYVVWSPEGDIPCSPDGIHRTYCTPEVYPAITNCLFRNTGENRFENVSRKAGVEGLPGKALGLVTVDSNNDGWPDLVVANDTEGNFLLINQHDGTFSEVGIESGIAYSESGAARGGMGIDAGDIDGDGLVDIVIGNFSQEMTAYFRGIESGYFMDDAAQVGIGLPTLMTLAFGTLVEDIDNDGWLDVLLVNGHIEPEISLTRQSQSYRQAPQFFRNLGRGRFEVLNPDLTGLADWLLVARGFASGDYDQDGDLDFVVTQNGGPAYLLRNNQAGNNWIRFSLVGRESNRIGYGAKVRVLTEGAVVTRYLESGRSYMSASEPKITVGLGKQTNVKQVEVTWPSGRVQTLESPVINTIIEVVEPVD